MAQYAQFGKGFPGCKLTEIGCKKIMYMYLLDCIGENSKIIRKHTKHVLYITHGKGLSNEMPL